MASVAKTIVATGVSSGLGFESIKQVLEQKQAYKILVGARSVANAQKAFDDLSRNNSQSSIKVLPTELSKLSSVKTFAHETLKELGQTKLDYLLLNAACTNPTNTPGPHGSKWSEQLIVNHVSQFYLVHLLRERLEADKSRIVFVSSGAIRMVSDTSVLESQLKANSDLAEAGPAYGASKFVQLLGAHWWRRELQGKCRVVATSPGMIPGTGLGRGSGMSMPHGNPDAKSVPEGGANVLRAVFIEDFPEDPEQFFLTSWGEWWPKDTYGLSLDKGLQDKWSWSQSEIEKEADAQKE